MMHVSRVTLGPVYCLGFFLLLLAWWTYWCVHFGVGPDPTDDIFYIDAATKLATGEYVPPSPISPYHHYLRWPVVVPLAASLWLFDFAPIALSAFAAFHFVAIQTVTYALAFRVYGDHLRASVASLAVFLIPTGMLPPLIRAEPPAVLWAMLALALLAWRDAGPRRLLLVAAGVCLAIAVDANQVCVFSVPLALVFLAGTARAVDAAGGWRGLAWECAWFLVGMVGAMFLIMAVEGVAFGDPLIQMHAVTWWHLRSSDWNALRQSYLNPESTDYFVFGFILGLLRQYPLYVSAAFLVLLVTLALRDGRSRPRIVMLSSALVGLLALELAGPIVVQKVYLRLLAVPCFVLSVALLVEAAELFGKPHLATLAGGVAAALAIFVHTSDNWKAAVRESSWVYYYRDPIVRIKAEADRANARSEDVQIFFETQGHPLLIPWSLAIGVYSQRRFTQGNVVVEPDAPKVESLRLLNFYVLEKENGAGPAGFSELSYASPSPMRRPRVFVLRRQPAAELPTK